MGISGPISIRVANQPFSYSCPIEQRHIFRVTNITQYPLCALKVFDRVLASWHPKYSLEVDHSHRTQSSTTICLPLAPEPDIRCVLSRVPHHLLLRRNSSTRGQVGTSASCTTKMRSFSCRAFQSEVSFPFLCPCLLSFL